MAGDRVWAVFFALWATSAVPVFYAGQWRFLRA